jgi:hypothetical protein
MTTSGAVPPIIHVAAELGQGGTERSIELLATSAAGPAGQRVFALDQGGPTADRLLRAGVEVRLFDGNIEAAATAIAAAGPATVLLNRAGRPEAKWNQLIRQLKGGPATLIDVNHFGWLDRGAIADGVAGVWCVSGTALAKYLRLAMGRVPTVGDAAGFGIALAAGNNPVAPAPPRSTEPRAALRRRLGLPVDRHLVLRLGRPDPRKWSDLLILHAAWLVAAMPDLHFVFLSAPEGRRAVIEASLGDHVSLVPFSTERQVIQDHLAAADVMLHYARYGESFGYALAEAASVELPAVVQATPWGDNAQLELVRNGVTGFVAGSFAEVRRNLERLRADPGLRTRLGAAARGYVESEFGVEPTWRLLAAFIAHARAGGRGLLAAPEELAASQQARLARGIANYGVRFPRLARLRAEAPLYRRPWFWRHLAGDMAAILARRVAARQRLVPIRS